MKKIWIESPFFHSRGNYPLDMIIIHHIGSKGGKLYSVNGTISWFTNEEIHRNKKTGKIENKVSAHYIIPRTKYQDCDCIHMVKESDIAYHAGQSQWVIGGKLRKFINRYSVGIELEGDGDFCEYTDFQYDALVTLCKELIEEYNIPENNIVGHEEISPGRKVDPGKLFDWKRFHENIKPASILMPDIHIISGEPSPDLTDKVISDEEFYMEGGEDSEKRHQGLFSLAINFLQKLAGKLTTLIGGR